MGKNYARSTLRGLAQHGEAGVRRVDSFRADPRVIEFEPGFNIRIQDDPELRKYIDGFKESIKQLITLDNPDNRVYKGPLTDVFPAIVVRVTEEGKILVVEGHSRLIAIRELITEGWDIEEVDVAVTKADAVGRIVMMVRSALGKPLEPIEKAAAYQRLADDHGLSFPQIGEMCGTSPQRVEQLLLLARSPAAIRDLVAKRKITADSAIEVIRKHREEPGEAVKVIEDLVANKGARPVGKGQVRTRIPPKVQDGLVNALRENTSLAKDLKAMAKEPGWEDAPIMVALPAGVLAKLLDQQGKPAAQKPAGDK